jgi:hypothetical protein
VLIASSSINATACVPCRIARRLGSPLRAAADRFCWDCWHVPGQYHVLRTPADAFFPPPLHEALVDALTEHGERQLGCRGISPLWLSCYLDGCRQEWHSDAPHGCGRGVASMPPRRPLAERMRAAMLARPLRECDHTPLEALHASPRRPFAFVLSLTRWQERRFSGGETM